MIRSEGSRCSQSHIAAWRAIDSETDMTSKPSRASSSHVSGSGHGNLPVRHLRTISMLEIALRNVRVSGFAKTPSTVLGKGKSAHAETKSKCRQGSARSDLVQDWLIQIDTLVQRRIVRRFNSPSLAITRQRGQPRRWFAMTKYCDRFAPFSAIHQLAETFLYFTDGNFHDQNYDQNELPVKQTVWHGIAFSQLEHWIASSPLMPQYCVIP
jgi:hypothetical protein